MLLFVVFVGGTLQVRLSDRPGALDHLARGAGGGGRGAGSPRGLVAVFFCCVWLCFGGWAGGEVGRRGVSRITKIRGGVYVVAARSVEVIFGRCARLAAADGPHHSKEASLGVMAACRAKCFLLACEGTALSGGFTCSMAVLPPRHPPPPPSSLAAGILACSH